MKETILYWHTPKSRIPVDIQAILFVYNDQVWTGVYSVGKVHRYPEDFQPINFDDCDLWCALPEVPL